VRAEVLLDANHPGRPGVRGQARTRHRRSHRSGHGGEVGRVRRAGQPGVSAARPVSYLPLAPSGTTPLRVLTIAGSDSGGGAGVQADIRTCALLGVHTLCAITAVTVQNSLGVKDFHKAPPDVVTAQIAAVCDDIGLQAAKTGMLASAEIIDAVAQSWREHGAGVPLVVDPVSASMHGDPLLDHSALDSLRAELFPLATVGTPNLHEVNLLVGIDVVDPKTQADAARALHALGPKRGMVKGGHLQGLDSRAGLLFNGT